MPDIIFSLPNSKQLEVGDFDLDQLVKRLTEVLADESRRSEIQKMTGDNAVLVIECLDRVSEIRSLSWCNVLITPKVISSDTFRANSNVQIRSVVLSTISRLSRGCQYLPYSYWIDPKTVTFPEERYKDGTCAEVFRGTRNGEPVAVKVLRISNRESRTKLIKVSTGRERNTRTRTDLMGNSVFGGR